MSAFFHWVGESQQLKNIVILCLLLFTFFVVAMLSEVRKLIPIWVVYVLILVTVLGVVWKMLL